MAAQVNTSHSGVVGGWWQGEWTGEGVDSPHTTGHHHRGWSSLTGRG